MAKSSSAEAPVAAPMPPQPATEVPTAPPAPPESTVPAADAPKPEEPAAPEPKVLVAEGQLLPEAPKAPDTNDRAAHVQHRKETVVDSLAQLVGGKITALVQDEELDQLDGEESQTYGLQIEIEQIQGPNIVLIAWIQSDAQADRPGFLAIENKGARRG